MHIIALKSLARAAVTIAILRVAPRIPARAIRYLAGAAAAATLATPLAGCGGSDFLPESGLETSSIAEIETRAPSARALARMQGKPVTSSTEANATNATTDQPEKVASAVDVNNEATIFEPFTGSGTVNSIETIIDDMKLMNDAPLAGIPSNYGFATGPGFVVMGANPRGTGTPSWWKPWDQTYKTSEHWHTLMPWVVVFDGVGNEASNSRVEMRDLKAYYKSHSTGKWELITAGTVSGRNYPKTLTGSITSAPDLRTEAGGTTSIRPTGGDLVFHGWCCGKASINAPDIAAVHITMQARLIVDDAARPDDRLNARYLVHVGGDYYPTASTSIEAFAPTGYNPGIGMSRAKLINNNWQSISFTTLNVGSVEPTGTAITEQVLRAAPPPME